MKAILLALLFSSQSWAAPTSDRIKEIKDVAEIVAPPNVLANVTIRDNDQLPMPAGSYKLDDGSFLIEINPNIMNTLTEAGRNFITYHELGHIRLGHVNNPWPGPEAARELELEADVYAALLYKHLMGVDHALFDFITFIEGRTHTVPSGPERAALIREVLDL